MLDGRKVPFFRIRIPAAVLVDDVVCQALGERQQVRVRVDGLVVFIEANLVLEQLPPQCVDVFALLVHHVVVLKQVLANGKVLPLDLLLCALNRLGHHAVLDRHPFLHAKTIHQALDPVRAEDAHQIVLERQIEPGRSRIALAAGAPRS